MSIINIVSSIIFIVSFFIMMFGLWCSLFCKSGIERDKGYTIVCVMEPIVAVSFIISMICNIFKI